MLNKVGSYSMVKKYNLSFTRQPLRKIEIDLNAIYHLQVRYHVNTSLSAKLVGVRSCL